MARVRGVRGGGDPVIEAAEYFADEEPDQLRTQYRIRASTGDLQLPAIVAFIRAREGEELPGLPDFVRQLRDAARDIERTGLQETAAEISLLTAQRDQLIRRIAGWGDTDHELAALARLSPEEVRQVIAGP